ncbi:MAG TPA: hypothetical protein VHS33_13835 [Sphingomicrobium sp.]|nr:hypothetical protein [Sphingomicrobium sp.]
MRRISLLIAGSILASCTMGPQATDPAMRSPSGQRAYQSLIANRVPGPPLTCLPNYNSHDMTIIDGRNIAFNVGLRTVYLVRLTPGCELLGGGGPYALLSRQFGSQGTCRGDIQQVVDTLNRGTVGSCTVAEIIPYTRP